MDKREQARLRKQRQRDKEKAGSVTLGSVTPESVTLKDIEEAGYRIITPGRKEKLLKICHPLDKETRGIDGRKVKLGSMVRYGVNGLTMDKVGEILASNNFT